MKTLFFKGKDADHYKLEILGDATDEEIDVILDQINIADAEFIREKEFFIANPMTVDVMSEDELTKVAILTCNNIYVDDKN